MEFCEFEPYLEHLDRLLEPAQLPGAHGEPAPDPRPANQMTDKKKSTTLKDGIVQ
jgi:hypothetical protein